MPEPQADSRHTRLFVADVGWLNERVHGLLRMQRDSGVAALEQIRQWHPKFAECSDEEIRQAEFAEADAQLVYAREHGFDSWRELEERVRLLAGDAQTEPFWPRFKRCKRAI